MVATSTKPKLALLGGDKAVQTPASDQFVWPVITPEDEAAVLEVLRRRAMSGTDVTKQFELEYAAWQGSRHALGHSTGTAALEAAMFGCGVGIGNEIVCPSITYWASCLPAYNLGATVVFAEIDPTSLCLDPADFERRITPSTKAVVVVHYLGHPADMDAILPIARRHGIKVIEDVSHAQGALYKGRRVGTLGDVAAASLMTGKSLAIGEAGMLTTDDRAIYERALAWGHYERFGADGSIEDPQLRELAGLPLGGHKYRMHQLSAAVGRVQLRHYDSRIAEIQRAMNRFWDLIEGTPGLRSHRPPAGSGSTMGGWYAARGLYVPEELGGLSVTRFAAAVRAEGAPCQAGVNAALHRHPLFSRADVYGHGRPTRVANAAGGTAHLHQPEGSLPVSEGIGGRTYSIPWLKYDRPKEVEQYAAAFRKVAEHAHDLLDDDPGNPPQLGGWNFFAPA